jgi:hypothetical protein
MVNKTGQIPLHKHGIMEPKISSQEGAAPQPRSEIVRLSGVAK